MRRLRHFKTLGFRVSVVVAVVVFSSICLVSSLYIARDFQRTVTGERERLQGVAAAFSAAASKPVAESNRRAVFEVLRGIRALPDTKYVAVSKLDGETIAEIGGAVTLQGRDGDAGDKSLLGFLRADMIVTHAPIRFNGAKVGALEIDTDIGWLRARYLDSLIDTLLVGLAAIALTVLAANLVIRRLTRPLRSLTKELEGLGETEELTHRFQHAQADEVGVLADAFNDAFARIEARDRAIRHHRDTLEETVALRTSELSDAVVDAERANAAKSDFLATMSHEIRTPMNGMLVMAELLAASSLSPKHHRYAEVISRSGRSLLNIINDILDLSKIESGRLDLEQVPFSLGNLVEDTVSLFSARAREKGLSLAMHMESAVADAVIADPTRLGQIVSNLTNNALKFTETGGVTIRVLRRTDSHAPDGRQGLRIEVVDTGVGIPADRLDAVFEQFTQADEGITRQFGGTGLGLSISRRLVDTMDGHIGVTSEVGVGTCFYVHLDLPLDAAAGEAASVCAPAGHRVLVVDPDAITAAATADTLTDRSFDVVVASTFDPAEDAFDLVLARPDQVAGALDGRMAGGRNAPVIMMRVHADENPAGQTEAPLAGTLTLPLTRTAVDLICQAVESDDFSGIAALETARTDPAALPDFSHLRVLAVDDNAVNREVLNEYLTTLKIAATFAVDGEQAVETFARNAFDLVFMDCSMPGMDGYQATAEIRRLEAEAGSSRSRVVALTAHVTGADAERWREAGMDGYVAKPFTIGRLADELASASPEGDRKATPVGDVPVDNGPPTAPTSNEDAAPLLSPETLELLASLDASMTGRVFTMFSAQAPDSLDAIRKAVDSGCDAAEAGRLIHALKSMCSSAGAARMAAACEQLESRAKTDVLPTRDALDRLADLTEATKTAMGDYAASLHDDTAHHDALRA